MHMQRSLEIHTSHISGTYLWYVGFGWVFFFSLTGIFYTERTLWVKISTVYKYLSGSEFLLDHQCLVNEEQR